VAPPPARSQTQAWVVPDHQPNSWWHRLVWAGEGARLMLRDRSWIGYAVVGWQPESRSGLWDSAWYMGDNRRSARLHECSIARRVNQLTVN
jgi:hypothetical protein